MKKIVSVLLVLGLLFGFMVGCGKDNPSKDSASTPVAASKTDIKYVDADGDAVYRVIRPAKSESSDAAQKVFKAFKDIGIRMVSTTDWEDGTDTYEILVGNTNRAETDAAKSLLVDKTGGRFEDYIICSIGQKIVIYSKSDKGLTAAVDYFVKTYVNADGVKGGIEYALGVNGEYENITINSTSLGRYNFIRPHYNSSYLVELEMQKMSEDVFERSGFYFDILHDTKEQATDFEIIVGNAEREGVVKIENPDEYSIRVQGKKVYLNGGSAHATAMAVTEFSKMFNGNITDTVVTGNYSQTVAGYDKSTYFAKSWGDDFDGAALDSSKWGQVTETDSAPGKNGKLSVRSGDPRDVYVSDGKFTIAAREDENYYYGGMIWTSGKMYYKYGYLEMSALLPHGEGFWSALWTWSNDTWSSDGAGTALTRPEIDIVEMFGNSKYYAANCHAWPTPEGEKLGFTHTSLDNTHANDKKYTLEDEDKVLGDDFHTYGFLWDDTMMGFTCDGDLYFTYDTTTNDNDKEAFNHMMYLRISMANNWESAPYAGVSGTPEDWLQTNKYIVDWINIYQYDDQKSVMHCGPLSSYKQ